MAQKRMFDKAITNSDDFIEMPDSSQNLYFHLSMNADDDGFVNNWKSIVRMTGHKYDDMKILITKQFIIPFDSGVIVIRHWRINNYLRSDRYMETKFLDEKKQLTVDDRLVYQINTNGIPSGNQLATQNRIDKNSIEKNSIDKNSIDKISLKEIKIEKKSKGKNLCPAKQDDIPYQEIIDYFNLVVGTRYKASTKKTREHIHARWMDGYRLDDFKLVIDKKYKEWINTDLETYLRPETLFATKFESYLNQIERERKYTTKDLAQAINWENY